MATPMQTQSVFEKPISRKKDKPKKDHKPSTFEQTYDLYKTGSTPEQIAEMRGLTLNTIFGHLIKYVESGQIQLSELVPIDMINKILSARQDNPEFKTLKEFYELFNQEISYTYLRVVLDGSHLL